MYSDKSTHCPPLRNTTQVFAASVVICVVVTVQAVLPKVIVIIPESFNEWHSTKLLWLIINIFNIIQSPHVDIVIRNITSFNFTTHLFFIPYGAILWTKIQNGLMPF